VLHPPSLRAPTHHAHEHHVGHPLPKRLLHREHLVHLQSIGLLGPWGLVVDVQGLCPPLRAKAASTLQAKPMHARNLLFGPGWVCGPWRTNTPRPSSAIHGAASSCSCGGMLSGPHCTAHVRQPQEQCGAWATHNLVRLEVARKPSLPGRTEAASHGAAHLHTG